VHSIEAAYRCACRTLRGLCVCVCVSDTQMDWIRQNGLWCGLVTFFSFSVEKNERLSSDSDLRFMKLIYELELDSLGLGREWTNVSYRSKTREHAHTQTPGRLR